MLREYLPSRMTGLPYAVQTVLQTLLSSTSAGAGVLLALRRSEIGLFSEQEFFGQPYFVLLDPLQRDSLQTTLGGMLRSYFRTGVVACTSRDSSESVRLPGEFTCCACSRLGPLAHRYRLC